MVQLRSTISGTPYSFDRIEEYAENGEPLEVELSDLEHARIRSGHHVWERFSDFMPFSRMDPDCSLGEGNTPLIRAGNALKEFAGLEHLQLKNETQNPTWSFKDRGSLTCMFMAKEMNERISATISTGNMGHSIAAYSAKSGIHALVFVPPFTPDEKLHAMTIHGATVIRVAGPDYSVMKQEVLALAARFRLRIVSGNGPIRVEGYKLTAFEMYEQMEGDVPDYIAVPTSACGHVRGLFKGYVELRRAGMINDLPKMIIVQARNNSPIVSAIKQRKDHIVPFSGFHTVAEAITTGIPQGGDELIDKVRRYGWLAEDVTEEEILESQRRLAGDGLFVEPAAATSLSAVKSLRQHGTIPPNAHVVLMLTGSGLKDFDVFRYHRSEFVESDLTGIERDLERIMNTIRTSD